MRVLVGCSDQLAAGLQTIELGFSRCEKLWIGLVLLDDPIHERHAVSWCRVVLGVAVLDFLLDLEDATDGEDVVSIDYASTFESGVDFTDDLLLPVRVGRIDRNRVTGRCVGVIRET